jgi:hypothetical protein
MAGSMTELTRCAKGRSREIAWAYLCVGHLRGEVELGGEARLHDQQNSEQERRRYKADQANGRRRAEELINGLAITAMTDPLPPNYVADRDRSLAAPAPSDH